MILLMRRCRCYRTRRGKVVSCESYCGNLQNLQYGDFFRGKKVATPENSLFWFSFFMFFCIDSDRPSAGGRSSTAAGKKLEKKTNLRFRQPPARDCPFSLPLELSSFVRATIEESTKIAAPVLATKSFLPDNQSISKACVLFSSDCCTSFHYLWLRSVYILCVYVYLQTAMPILDLSRSS